MAPVWIQLPGCKLHSSDVANFVSCTPLIAVIVIIHTMVFCQAGTCSYGKTFEPRQALEG